MIPPCSLTSTAGRRNGPPSAPGSGLDVPLHVLAPLVLANKLIPDDPGYIGVKFNHFLPNALGIKQIIEYLVTHLSEFWWFMAAFTIIEFLVGLMLMLRLLFPGWGRLLFAGWHAFQTFVLCMAFIPACLGRSVRCRWDTAVWPAFPSGRPCL